MAELNEWNAARRKNIDWRQVRHVYENSPIGLGECARQLGCSRSIVARRYYRERWRKADGVPYDRRTGKWTEANLRYCTGLPLELETDLLPDFSLDFLTMQ
jgi:hypothetical protein